VILQDDPDDFEVDSGFRICDHHRKHPFDTSYAGCTCAGWYTRTRKKRDDR
jgi:hypothetical protein